MKIVFLSDTHGLHTKVDVPDGDVLVHAGDITNVGKMWECQEALDWLHYQKHKHVITIAGNHDFGFERETVKTQLNFGRVNYLENSSINIDGVNFYGSPVTPWFMDWAFNVHRGDPIKKYWDMIPEIVDVLITHGPPLGVLDQVSPGEDHLGCEELAKAVLNVQPLIHVFGHIHGGRGSITQDGTHFINASVVDEAYRVVHPPYVVSING